MEKEAETLAECKAAYDRVEAELAAARRAIMERDEHAFGLQKQIAAARRDVQEALSALVKHDYARARFIFKIERRAEEAELEAEAAKMELATARGLLARIWQEPQNAIELIETTRDGPGRDAGGR